MRVFERLHFLTDSLRPHLIFKEKKSFSTAKAESLKTFGKKSKFQEPLKT